MLIRKADVITQRNELQDEIERLESEVQFYKDTLLEMGVCMASDYSDDTAMILEGAVIFTPK